MFKPGDEVLVNRNSELVRKRSVRLLDVFAVVECVKTIHKTHLSASGCEYVVRVKHTHPMRVENSPGALHPMEFFPADEFDLLNSRAAVVQHTPITRTETIRYVSEVTLNSTTCKLNVTYKEATVSIVVQ